MMTGPVPPGRGFWREMSVGLGFAGLSMMGLLFFLTDEASGVEREELHEMPRARRGLKS
jgi:hypothetical protein